MSPVTERDPVCGMDVDPNLTRYHVSYRTHLYHFCSGQCQLEFERDPDTYALV